MSDEYTPTTEEARAFYNLGCRSTAVARAGENFGAEFDRWLAAHDAEVARAAAEKALREAADAWQVGGWANDPPPKTSYRPAIILGMAQRATDWLRARADCLAAGGEG